jgi:hypothetical protein
MKQQQLNAHVISNGTQRKPGNLLLYILQKAKLNGGVRKAQGLEEPKSSSATRITLTNREIDGDANGRIMVRQPKQTLLGQETASRLASI